jgi:hypothetical protein
MRNSILISVFLLFSYSSYSQNDSIRSWVDDLSRSTISFGRDTVVDFRESNGNIVKKRVFDVIGTGVVFYIKLFRGKDTIIVPTIVTAKHVFYNPDENYFPKKINVRFKWDEKRPLDKYFGIQLDLVDERMLNIWIPHPDPSVDLASLPVNFEGKILDRESLPVLPYNIISDLENAFEGQEVYALGFPGVGGLDYATKPIVRRGIISWISPNEPNRIPFLIDCNVFPGNSGGPIFSSLSGIGKQGGFSIGGGFSFLGIVSKGLSKINPVVSPNYRYLLDDKGGKLLSTETFSLGIIEPAARIRELLQVSQKLINQ